MLAKCEKDEASQLMLCYAMRLAIGDRSSSDNDGDMVNAMGPDVVRQSM